MMIDLDQMLGAVRTLPTDARLADMDAAVMDGFAKRRDRMTARRSLMLAGLLAVGIVITLGALAETCELHCALVVTPVLAVRGPQAQRQWAILAYGICPRVPAA